MAKRVNKPAVAVLTLGLMFVLTIVGVLLVKAIPSKDITPMVKSAEQAIANRDYRAAVTFYKQAFDRSQDAKWLVEAGKAAREWGEAGTAFGMWQTAIMKDPSFVDARQNYVALWIDMIELNDWHAPGDTASRVAEYADALLKTQPDDFNGLFARGISSLALRQDKPELELQGLEDLQKALAMRPDDERVLMVLGQYYVADKKQPAKAQKLYENLIQQQKDSPVGYLMLGRFFRGQEKVDEAIASLTKAVDLSKGSAKTLTMLAQAYQDKKDNAKADELLLKALQTDPDGFDAYLQRSMLLVNTGKPQEAVKIAKEWLDKPTVFQGFKSSRYRSQRIRMLLQAANASVVQSAPTQETDKPNEALLKQAEDYLVEVDKEMGKDAPLCLLVRADIQRLRGQSIKAIKLLEQADTAFNSASADVKLRLAELYRQDGNLGAAQKELTALVRLAPTFPRGYYLQALIAAQLDKKTEALAFLDQGLALAPKDKDMRQLKVLVLQALGGREKEIKTYEDAVPSDVTSVADKLQRAHRKLAEERPEEAEALYREVLAAEPANMTALRIMLQMLIQSGKTDEARQLCDKAKAVAGDNPRIRDLEFLFAANLSPEQREQKIFELVQAEPDPAIRDTQLYVFYVSRQKYDEAQKAADDLETRQPGTDRVIRMQFALALVRQDWDRAKKYVDMAGERDLDGAEGGFLRSQLAMRRGDMTKAQSELEQALTRYPTHPNGWIWLSEIYIQTKQYDRARDVLLNKALEINPVKGEAFKNLAFIADQQGDQAAYRTNLEKAMRYFPSDAWVVERGTYLREQEDPDGAIKIRRKVLESKPDDLENMIRLALLLEKQKQHKEAGDLLTRAAAAAPKDLRVLSTVAGYWQRRQEPDRAEKIITDYEQAAQGEDKAAANVVLAELYLQLGKADKAEQAYSVAAKVSSRPDIKARLAEFYRGVGRIKDAADVYRQAVESAGKDTAAQAAMRQKLVELLLQSQKLAEAAAEIEAYHTALPDDPSHLLMRGTLLMFQGQTEPAVAALSDFLQKNRNSAVGLFNRGMLYLAMNRLPQAIDDLQAAKSLQPAGFRFEHRVALAQALEATKQADRAVSELKDILQSYPVQSYPDSMAAAKALAMLYQRMERVQDFEALAETFIAQLPDDWSWSMELGRFRENAGNLPRAIKCYSQAVQASKGNPEAVDNLLRAHIVAKQYDQAIEYVQKQIPEQARIGPVKARMAEAHFRKGQQDKARTLYKEALHEVTRSYGASVMVLQNISSTLTPQEAIQMLRDQLAAQPDDTATKFLLASALIGQEKYDEALPLNDQLLAAAKTDEDKHIILRQRGAMLYEGGKYDQAAKAYEQLLTVVPDDADSLNNVAYIYAENLNRPAEALPYARRAVELRPRSADVLDTLGWVQYLAGDMNVALGTLVSALQQSPNNVAARYHVGMVYKKKADLDQAKREFEHAQELIKSDPRGVLSKLFEERVRKELTELAGRSSNVAGK